MPSAKGKPTDPKLKEKVTEEVKQQPNKDGSGKGQMAAWKAAKIGKEYEARGGDYENEPGSKDKPEKGPPQKKSEATKKAETSKSKSASKAKPQDDEEEVDDKDEKPKANEGKKARGRPKGDGAKATKEKKEPRQGERASARQKGEKADDKGVEKGTKRKSVGGEESAAKKKK
ncbi:hypothetical protein N431DRAFT_441361 [Stipitochalara longipes BDJ]|nr:hypothetical protein N431DRAFT_441361 [Stipitochalara longipes BDJ]